jgi:hypothetical protein
MKIMRMAVHTLSFLILLIYISMPHQLVGETAVHNKSGGAVEVTTHQIVHCLGKPTEKTTKTTVIAHNATENLALQKKADTVCVTSITHVELKDKDGKGRQSFAYSAQDPQAKWRTANSATIKTFGNKLLLE